VVLVVCLDLLRRAWAHEAFDFAAISTYLPSGQFSQGVLRYDRHHHAVEFVGDCQRACDVCADTRLLDGGGFLQRSSLFASVGSLVSRRTTFGKGQRSRLADRHRYANAAINILTDCATALLPIGVINSLDMPKRQKKLLLVVFGIGLL
jgi:hypothetical protein